LQGVYVAGTGTDWPSLAVEVVKTLTWPVTVLIIFFVLRKPIAGLIPFLDELRYKDLAVTFRRRLVKAEEEATRAQLPPPPLQPRTSVPQPAGGAATVLPDYLYPMAVTSPVAAVLEAWVRIENELRRRLESGDLAQPSTTRALTRELVRAGLLPSDAERIVIDLRDLRNNAAHGRVQLDPEDAIRYLDLGTRLLAAMDRKGDLKASG
jgi:hypothetical protein